jgi:hypothetical protein
MTKNCLRKCEDLLAREDEEDGRPEAPEGWARWLNTVKEGASRKDTLPKLTAEVSGLQVQQLTQIHTITDCCHENVCPALALGS